VARSSPGANVSVAIIDATILAFAGLLQPTNAKEVFSFAKGTFLREVLNKTTFDRHFERLAKEAFLWQTATGEYVVTPKGDLLARRSLQRKERDKLRLLILNERRYKT